MEISELKNKITDIVVDEQVREAVFVAVNEFVDSNNDNIKGVLSRFEDKLDIVASSFRDIEGEVSLI